MAVAEGPALSTVAGPGTAVGQGGLPGCTPSLVTVHILPLSLAVFSVTCLVPRDTPAPSLCICAHAGKSGCVALGTVQDTKEKRFMPYRFCLAGLSVLGCLRAQDK